MKKYEHARSSLFLFELILSLLLFTVLVVIGLNFFIKSHVLTGKTSILHRAVTECNNVATLYETSNGSLKLIERQYPYSVVKNDRAIIYFDADFNECDSRSSSYLLLIQIADSHSSLNTATISFSNEKESLYEFEVCSYRQLTPSSKEVP